jgi:GMP/IMP 5'-nucleotidase
MVDWQKIKTVLLDMDGTLLDLKYDNYFWQEFVPLKFAARHGLKIEEAKRHLRERYSAVAGTLDWYCVDYWTQSLNMDIAILKEEISHLIAVHPHVIDFLTSLRSTEKRLILVTNAHHKSLTLKMKHTRLVNHFDLVVCAHDLGIPKEDSGFWERLQQLEGFDPQSTLLIDDNDSVLRSARDYGINNLLSVHKPDSGAAGRTSGEFQMIRSFDDLMPVI